MKSILLIGMGLFGRHIAMKLYEMNHQVMAVDDKEDRIQEVLPYVTGAQIGDSTNEGFMRSLGVDNYDVCIVAIGGDFQSSLETTSLLKELGAKFVDAKFLLRNGADEVIYPEKQLAQWAAVRYSSEHILDYIELDGQHAVFEVKVPDAWLGRTVVQVDIRKKYNINIMGFRQGNKLSLTVTPDTVFTEDKTLMVLGRHRDIQKCFKI